MDMTAIDQHEAHLKYLNRRPNSIDQRRKTLRRIERHSGRPVLELDEAALRAFVEQPQLGVEARAAAVSHLRGFYQWAIDEALIEVDPSARLKRPKRERRIPRPMPTESAQFALSEAPSPIREWMYLAAYAGLRACEIAQLSGKDFLLSGRPTLIVRESKGGHPSTVPIAKQLLPVAHSLARSNGWCFPKGDGSPGHVTAGQVQRRLNRFLHDLGIEETGHQLRHWFGTETYKATRRDLRLTQEMMRHQSPVSTAGYTFVDLAEGAAALDEIPGLEGPEAA